MSRENFPSLPNAPVVQQQPTSNLTLAQIIKAVQEASPSPTPAPATQIATPQTTLALIMEAVKAVIPTIVQEVVKVVLEKLPQAQQTPVVPSTKEIVDEVLQALPAVLEIPTRADIEVIAKGAYAKLPQTTPKNVRDMQKAVKELAGLEGLFEAVANCCKFSEEFKTAETQEEKNKILIKYALYEY